MTTNYRSGGVDFDSLFDPDVMGDGPTAPGYKVGGVPLKYAKLSYGTKRANVGYAQAGVDVSNLWAAYGTAVYSLPFDGQTYLQIYNIPAGNTGYAGLSFRLTSTSAWQIYGYTPTVPVTSLLTGSVPAGAVSCKAVFGTVTTPSGYTGAGGTTSTDMGSPTTLASGIYASLQSGTFGAASGTRRSQVSVSITFYKTGGVAMSTSTCTFVVETDGSA